MISSDSIPVFFQSGVDFRTWLEQYHDTQKELWIGFYKKTSRNRGITYREAVDEALSFGWIDGIMKRVDEERYTHRFTPRKEKSTWSLVNIKRVEELKQLGRMHPSGLAAYGRRDEKNSGIYSFENATRELDESYEKKIKANKKAWEFFSSEAPWYRKSVKWWIMSAKRAETREKRLAILIEDSAKEKRVAHFTWESKTK